MDLLSFPPEDMLQIVDRIIHLIKESWLPVFLVWFITKFKEEISQLIGRIEEFDLFGNSVKTKKQQSEEPSKDEKKAIEEASQVESGEETKPQNSDDSERTMFLKNYVFEIAYREIFGSQINILLDLEANLSNWVPGSSLIKHYNNVGWTENKYPFREYMNYLNSRFLVEFKPRENVLDDTLDYYKLSNFGKEFLEYLRRNNISLVKQS